MVKLRSLAHSRAGDKGDTVNLSLIPYRPQDYELLKEQVTAERVKEHFAGLIRGEVIRYELPKLRAFNFVLSGVLSGGVTKSVALDGHGKSWSSLLLEMEIDLTR